MLSLYIAVRRDWSEVKVGFSRNPEKRVSGLHRGTSNNGPFKLVACRLIPGTTIFTHPRSEKNAWDLEKEFKKKFARIQTHPKSEFYRAPHVPEMTAFLHSHPMKTKSVIVGWKDGKRVDPWLWDKLIPAE